MIDGIIYKAVNKVSWKTYVGKTAFLLGRRIAAHLAWAKSKKGPHGGNSVYFHRALRKAMRSGVEFEWSIIDHAGTEEELNRKERSWIKKLSCKAPRGYNCTDGGEGLSNPSEETRKKMREAQRGENNPMKRPEVAAKVAAKISGENHPMKRPEVVAKISGKNHPMYGKHHTEKTKQLMREKLSGENNPMKRPEVVAKISGENSISWKGGKSVKGGCLVLLRPNHLRADHHGYVRAHFLEWEKRRGPIPPGKSVCFKDKTLRMIDRYGRRYKDPRISNLYIPGI